MDIFPVETTCQPPLPSGTSDPAPNEAPSPGLRHGPPNRVAPGLWPPHRPSR